MSITLAEQLKRRKPIVFRTPPPEGEELGRTLTTFQLMMFGVGATVGTGIFFVLSESVPEAGPAVIVSFLIAGLAAGLSALCYAELASAIPVSGSTYSYAYHAMGELVAVIIAGCVLLEYGVATAAVAVGWSGYFNELLDSTIGVQIPQALSTSFIAGPGRGGHRRHHQPAGGRPRVPVHVPAAPGRHRVRAGQRDHGADQARRARRCSSSSALTAFEGSHFDNFFGAGIGGITAAAGTIFFSFIGLDAVATAGEEVKDPQRSLPRAIIGALIIVTTVYVLVALAGHRRQAGQLLQHRGRRRTQGSRRSSTTSPARRSGAPCWPPVPSSRSSRSRS